MRISDRSSDGCSCDLPAAQIAVVTMPEQLEVASINGVEVVAAQGMWNKGDKRLELLPGRYQKLVFYRESWDSARDQIGRASCRDSVCQYGSISVVAVSLKQHATSNTGSHERTQ